MNKRYSTIVACLLLICFSTPVWATGNTRHQNHFYKLRERIRQTIVNHQFWTLKNMYNHTHSEAQQLFLDYLGTAVPSAQEQMQTLREEYEGEIAELNATIASYQQQLETLTAEMDAACEARLALAQQACQTATQQQIGDLAAAHQMELQQLSAQMNAACDARLAQAHLDWQAAAGEPCTGSGLLQKAGTIETGSVYPYAIDADASGNIFVLDRDRLTVSTFDSAGTLTAQWQPAGLVLPVDIAVDTQGAVYVLDQQAPTPLKKFAPDGTPMALNISAPITFAIGMDIDSQNRIYITDMGGASGGRALTFDPSGQLLQSFGEVPELAYEEYNDIVVDEQRQLIYIATGYSIAKFNMSGDYLESWAGYEFSTPYGIAVAANGDIIIANTFNNILQVYKSNGDFSYSFENDLSRPYRIFTDSTGKLYVADYRNMQIKIYE